jgi:excisionase family DNA binding protein
MRSAATTHLTPEEAAEIARCSIKTVRRAYVTGVLKAYRRRGSRAVLLDPQDVLEWVRGESLEATTLGRSQTVVARGRTKVSNVANRAGRVDPAQVPRQQARPDLSAAALRLRRDASTRPA